MITKKQKNDASYINNMILKLEGELKKNEKKVVKLENEERKLLRELERCSYDIRHIKRKINEYKKYK